jgi:hypothetical protein
MLTNSSFFGIECDIIGLTIGCWSKPSPMSWERQMTKTSWQSWSVKHLSYTFKHLIEIDGTSMHNTCMKKINWKCNVITKSYYTQTHHLCIYNFTLGNPFRMLFKGLCKGVWCLPNFFSMFLAYYLTNLEKSDLFKILVTHTIIKILP